MIANSITISRILFSLLMLLFPVLSPKFYICYLAAGLTDMVDGTVARLLGTNSKFGETLDTVADLVFVLIALYRIVPELKLSVGIWIWIGLIAVIKVINAILGFALQKRFVPVHSIPNKITGTVLYILPLTMPVIDIKYSAIVACAVATFSAIHEGYCIRNAS